MGSADLVARLDDPRRPGIVVPDEEQFVNEIPEPLMTIPIEVTLENLEEAPLIGRVVKHGALYGIDLKKGVR